MRAPESNHAVEKPATKVTSGAPSAAGAFPAPDESQVPAKAKEHNIHVSAAVLEAAAKDGAALLLSLHAAPEGLTQAEAEERARTSGPNEVAQER
jgi:Mg2+-importing ATPase